MQGGNLYGVDWDGPLPLDEDNAVIVPSTLAPLPEEEMEQLTSQVNPLAISNEFGIDLYLECLQFIQSKLY